METIKKFKKEDLTCMQSLIGQRLSDIFYQPTKEVLDDNIFVFNFGTKDKYSLHVKCFVRASWNDKIILTSSDEYFALDYMKMDSKTYNQQEHYEKSLLSRTIKALSECLKSTLVVSVDFSSVADIIISFNNGVKLEITPDCLFKDYEYYRFFNQKKGSPHYVVSFINEEIVMVIQ